MRIGQLLGIGAAVMASFGVLGVITYQFFWDPDQTFETAPDNSASRVTDGQLAQLSQTRVFFGHKSVGRNILSGVESLYDSHDTAPPTMVEVEPGEVPELAEGGVLVESSIGENRHPYRKLENFEATLRAGLSSEVDVALVKFCYIDIRWDSDVERLFSTYKETMERLQEDYPDVRFVHATAPLTTGPYGLKDHIKMLVGRNDNANRERYNQMMRATYGKEQLLDIALVEGTAPDGIFHAELHGGYSSDGAHLNATGQGVVAAEFVRLLAAQPED